MHVGKHVKISVYKGYTHKTTRTQEHADANTRTITINFKQLSRKVISIIRYLYKFD